MSALSPTGGSKRAGAPQLADLPLLTGIVVHWFNEAELSRLLAAWPADPRFELLVVDNGSQGLALEAKARLLQPGTNLGFSGAVNLALAQSSSPIVLILNPDARPEPGALEALLAGFAAHPEAAGLAPKLTGEDGSPQWPWQLRRLPGTRHLLAQAIFLAPHLGAPAEPASGTPIEQPAAAALALRRSALERVGGFDEQFYPAWFEDVDLAWRLRREGLSTLYWPEARFVHGLGASVSRLGFGPFLWVYQRNLWRYTVVHSGLWAALALRLLLPLGALARLAALPLRRPQRAASWGEAAQALWMALAGGLTGWRFPRALASRFCRPEAPSQR